jgi:hypothetical protein
MASKYAKNILNGKQNITPHPSGAPLENGSNIIDHNVYCFCGD